MSSRPDANAPQAFLVSWMAALGSMLGAIVFTVIGQAFGAALCGCVWIGATLPIHRQPWALVNQPSLAFASQASGLGYWLGGVALCLAISLLAVNILPRPRGLVWELATIQMAWGAAVVGLGWIPLIDPWDGHVSKLLRLYGHSTAWVWVFPVLGAWAGLIATIRLLALVRSARPRHSRAGRLATVIFHQAVPVAVWIGAGTMLAAVNESGTTSGTSSDPTAILFRLWAPAFGAALPVIAAISLAWFAYPRPWVGRLEDLRSGGFVVMAAGVALLLSLCLFFGRPIPPGSCSGVLWAPANSRNNVRPWIKPIDFTADRGLSVQPSQSVE